MPNLLPLAVYGLPLAAIWAVYLGVRRIGTARSTAAKAAAIEAGLTEPASLHPVIDPALCLGCGACAAACPEGRILGLINGKAELVQPSECIGHGACKEACPFGAVTLVFGTATRGIDIPRVFPNFETSVPGIFIAGELGGMGLIRNAIEQGRQAVDSIRRLDGLGRRDRLDVVIVGAGPAGISASLAAMEHRLRSVTVEQDSFGGTVAHFPRGKVVMTRPAILPLYGRTAFREVSKEELLAFWEDVARRTGLSVSYGERAEAVVPCEDGFEVRTTRAAYRTRAVLLAIGRRGTPRRLDVPGEDQPKVVYRLSGPEQYRGQDVLVVGGGDSALEAAASLAEVPQTNVALSYRSTAFSRAKPKNRQRVETAAASGRLKLLLGTQVTNIGPASVTLEQDGQSFEIPNTAVIVCAGGVLPSAFLKSIGIDVETKYGTA